VAQNYPASGMPPMIGKMLSIAEWLDYVASYDFGTIPPTRVVLHHTYIPNEQQWRGLASMQGMQTYYRGLGWSSAPHIYVGPDGIWLFTPMRDVGIHAGRGNSGTQNGRFWYSIGVEMVGYFDKVRPAGAVWEGTKAVLGGLSRRLNTTPDKLISFHRDYTNEKSCPGWAVTKPWVFGEVNAWLNNQAAPPAPPPGTVSGITPETEALFELLTNESYSRRGEGYSANSALIVAAVEQGMGFPMGKTGEITVDGKQYAFQPFARDTLYSQLPDRGTVLKLSDLLKGSIPPGGLGRALLDATYQASGATFRPDWAFHQFAVINRVGPPVGPSAEITVNGVKYAFQAYALDTLFNVVPNWTDIQLLSELANATDPGMVQLREALLSETYKRGGAEYRPDWAFHQLARQWNLGCPISRNYTVSSGGAQYAIQVYATDTLYNIVPNWSDVRRLSATLPSGATLSGEDLPKAPIVLSDKVTFKPRREALDIVVYALPRTLPAVVKADRSVTSLIVMQGDPSPAETALERLVAPGSQKTPHYYISAKGTIYQLADDTIATKHAGIAVWGGSRRYINFISIGVMLERSGTTYPDVQVNATQRLLAMLRKRYNLAPDAIVEWNTLAGRGASTLPNFPLARVSR
jgi:hypothetical protein